MFSNQANQTEESKKLEARANQVLTLGNLVYKLQSDSLPITLQNIGIQRDTQNAGHQILIQKQIEEGRIRQQQASERLLQTFEKISPNKMQPNA